MTTTLLDRLPQDVTTVLSLAPGVAGLPALGPSREPGGASVTEQVMGALGKGTLVESSGAVGIAVWIGEIEADSAETNLPTPVLDGRLRVTVLENMLLNRTGRTVLEVAVAVAGALHHWTPGENIALIPDRPFFVPTAVGDADTMLPDPDIRGYELTWRLPSLGLETAARTRGPSASYNEETGFLTLTCDDVSAAIWFTTDDQGGVPALPAPGEPQANFYTAPVAVAAGTTVRAAAYADGCQPSQVLMLMI